MENPKDHKSWTLVWQLRNFGFFKSTFRKGLKFRFLQDFFESMIKKKNIETKVINNWLVIGVEWWTEENKMINKLWENLRSGIDNGMYLQNVLYMLGLHMFTWR